jgi:hypothetical protein
MPISAKNKSPRGESGLDETSLEELTQTSLSETIPEPLNKSTLESVDPPTAADVPVADASVETASQRYSATDAKLASRMTRDIAQHLGLAGKSRSVKI